MTNLISVDQFRKEARAGGKPVGGVFRVSTVKPKAFEDGSRKIRFCFSDGSVDRMGDTIDPNGWDTADFDRNPVALWAHDSSQPPIGRASAVSVEGKRLMGDIEFASAETYEFADTIFKLVLGGFLNAVSVGFIPTEYAFVDNDPDRRHGVDFKQQTLLEISVCPIPANPQALVQARAAGISTLPLVEWAERCLDGGGKITIPKSELTRLRKAAKEPLMAKRIPARRAAGASDDAPVSCGRKSDDECGMDDPNECAIHAGHKSEDEPDRDDEKALLRALKKLIGSRRKDADDGDKDGDEPPMAHEDAIRMAHKALRTSKAFLGEAVEHHAKAMGLLSDVVDALNDAPASDADDKPDVDDKEEPKDQDTEKAAQLRRVAALRRKHKSA